ncbi:MAG: hypothetical protein Q9188_004832 [Gyalolechia gomerana]
MPKSASAPATRLRKRNSTGWPRSSSNRLDSGRLTTTSIPDTDMDQEPRSRQEALTENTRPSSTPANSLFEFKGNGTAKSTWLRKMSTMSSSRDGSRVSTPLPGSPSISYSNGSTAPILSDPSPANASVTHRNKLVKRSSSHRALSSSTMHSTLRRPATSHQRSATLQQQYQPDERPVLHATPRSSLYFNDLQEEEVSSDESIQSWQCLFRPKNIRPGKAGSSRVRNAAGSVHRNETLKTIVPEVDKLPTLLLATSITPRKVSDRGQPAHVGGQGPTTSAGIEGEAERPWNDSTLGRRRSKADLDSDSRPRRSFSIADMFPSPSPSTWKIPRTGSLRRAEGSVGASSGRRVVSAPQSTKPRHTRGTSLSKPSHGSLARSKAIVTDNRQSPSPDSSPINAYGPAASSPLPPLNRLSAFEIELPGAAPSYPTTPQSDVPFALSRHSSPPSPSMSSPLGPFSNRNRSLHPSLAISDKGSTLLGSDNDNSRMLSGDEDDNEFGSETVYDSTRTGATGSSHSNIRKPAIETIFDESSVVDYQKNKAIALHELLSHDSFNIEDVQHNCITEEQESAAAPFQAAPLSKEGLTPASGHATSRQPLGGLSRPATELQAFNSAHEPETVSEEIGDQEVWAIESLSVSEKSSTRENPVPPEVATHFSSESLQSLSQGVKDFTPQSISEGSHKSSKPNISAWSESSPGTRDSFSPRPRIMNGIQRQENRGSRTTARRGTSALHSRSQSVPIAPESSHHRTNTSKLEAWVLGNKGVSEDWDCDFDFDESSPAPRPTHTEDEPIRTSISSGMLVPRSIMERQASVHGQFGHVKELTILVEELKLLREQACILDVVNGPSAELWKEADGIINLATLDDDDERDYFPPRSPNSPGFDLDPFEEDSPTVTNRRKSAVSQSTQQASDGTERKPGHHPPAHSTPERSRQDTPQGSRPRKESVAKAKSVLETIHQQRNHYSPNLPNERNTQKKLPFDTTSLRDLVTRAGVVKRALKEIVRRAEKAADTSPLIPLDPGSRDSLPRDPPPPKPDPPFSQIFQPPNSSPSTNKAPRATQSPKGVGSNFKSATISGNDNEINGHMKMMTVA